MGIESDKNNIIEKLIKTSSLLNELAKQPRVFGTGELLYSTEIHCIDIIYKNNEINLTQLSQKLGVSKSAVSKFVKKILSRNYIIKTKPIDNQKEVVFSVTEKGKVAALEHKKFTQEKFDKMYASLEKESAENIEIIIRFIDNFYEGLERM